MGLKIELKRRSLKHEKRGIFAKITDICEEEFDRF
jgi:hypothetical protein